MNGRLIVAASRGASRYLSKARRHIWRSGWALGMLVAGWWLGQRS